MKMFVFWVKIASFWGKYQFFRVKSILWEDFFRDYNILAYFFHPIKRISQFNQIFLFVWFIFQPAAYLDVMINTDTATYQMNACKYHSSIVLFHLYKQYMALLASRVDEYGIVYAIRFTWYTIICANDLMNSLKTIRHSARLTRTTHANIPVVMHKISRGKNECITIGFKRACSPDDTNFYIHDNQKPFIQNPWKINKNSNHSQIHHSITPKLLLLTCCQRLWSILANSKTNNNDKPYENESRKKQKSN